MKKYTERELKKLSSQQLINLLPSDIAWDCNGRAELIAAVLRQQAKGETPAPADRKIIGLHLKHEGTDEHGRVIGPLFVRYQDDPDYYPYQKRSNGLAQWYNLEQARKLAIQLSTRNRQVDLEE